ncbi:LytTR family DNA-binding domain-containing protein [Paremcibacter congregatus]|uniref:LytTR family DNA-binding domain-containing protein n=1 Tax=Paremcibacter congregatus TaxID=2043170 RepID=UPI0030ECC3FB
MLTLMKPLRKITALVLALLLLISTAAAQSIAWPEEQALVCPVVTGISSLPDFTAPACRQMPLTQIDPQNTALWVKLRFLLPPETQRPDRPYGLYVLGKTSSQAYFNGQYLGQNGTPDLRKDQEFPGKMDTVFYIPPALITSVENDVVLKLSSHHGFIHLQSPLHFIGVAPYADPQAFFTQDLWLSLVPLGALILGALYFAVTSLTADQRPDNLLFFLMCSLAAAQLGAELARSLFRYSYPLHDLRLLLIVSLALGFGLCLLWYVARRFARRQMLTWISGGGLVTLMAVILTPGFDAKTTLAFLIPSLCATVLLAHVTIQRRERRLWRYVAAFAVFSGTTLLTFTYFHDSIYYYIITGILCFLFAQQALEFGRERARRKAEELQVARLQFKLDQNDQARKPQTITIAQAGKITLVPTDSITHCQAAGDYVELYFMEKHPQLFSGSLKDLETQLPSTFLRVHRSFIVNTDFITALHSSGGTGYLKLTTDTDVPVSRRIMPSVRSVIAP